MWESESSLGPVGEETVSDLVDASITTHADRTCAGRRAYRPLGDLRGAGAPRGAGSRRGCVNEGLRSGDIVALWSVNSPPWAACQLAALHAGRCRHRDQPGLHPAARRRPQLRLARMVVAEPGTGAGRRRQRRTPGARARRRDRGHVAARGSRVGPTSGKGARRCHGGGPAPVLERHHWPAQGCGPRPSKRGRRCPPRQYSNGPRPRRRCTHRCAVLPRRSAVSSACCAHSPRAAPWSPCPDSTRRRCWKPWHATRVSMMAVPPPLERISSPRHPPTTTCPRCACSPSVAPRFR